MLYISSFVKTYLVLVKNAYTITKVLCAYCKLKYTIFSSDVVKDFC